MNYFKFCKASCTFIPGLSALLVLGLVGCDGGMVGTGSGPSDSIYKLENLPERISPDIPKTFLKGEELTPPEKSEEQKSESGDLSNYKRSDLGIQPKRADGWIELNSELSFAESFRVKIEANSTIVDLAFDDILSECAEQLLDCTIPADRISVTLTQEVVNRFINLYTDWAATLSPNVRVVEEGEDVNEVIETGFTSLLNTEVVLGETHYEQLSGMPYDHSITTVLKRGRTNLEYPIFPIWNDEKFSARWHEDGQVAKFTSSATSTTYDTTTTATATTTTTSTSTADIEYFYQNNVPSELVVSYLSAVNDDGSIVDLYTKILGNDPSEAGILVEVASSSNAYSSSSSGFASTVVYPEDGSADDPTVIVASSDGEITTYTTDDDIVSVDEDGNVNVFIEDTQSEVTVERVYGVFQGQLDNNGGYASLFDRFYDVKEENYAGFDGYRESFDRIGRLLAGERCYSDSSNNEQSNCDENTYEQYGPEGSSITDSMHYFKPGEFDSLAAMQDAIRWKVEGVPSEIKHVAVVSAESQNNLLESEQLCRAIQFGEQEVYTFCAATDEQLDNTVVVELEKGVPTRVIPSASLMQIQ